MRGAGRRYIAVLSWSTTYLLFGIAGATLISLLAAFPCALIAALVGFALHGAIGDALVCSLSEPIEYNAGLLNFLLLLREFRSLTLHCKEYP